MAVAFRFLVHPIKSNVIPIVQNTLKFHVFLTDADFMSMRTVLANNLNYQPKNYQLAFKSIILRLVDVTSTIFRNIEN